MIDEGGDIRELAARAMGGDAAADIELTRSAAAGSVDAQRALLIAMLDGAPQTFEWFLKVEMLARFVAIRGATEDVRRHAGILWGMAELASRRGETESALIYAAEAAVGMFRLADDGDGQVSNMLADLAAKFPDAPARAERFITGLK